MAAQKNKEHNSKKI